MRPSRVVSLAASNTEILWALGALDVLVGVDDYSDFPPEVARLPRVGPDLNIDATRVAALEPDLVLASLSVPGMERNIERLADARLPVLTLEPHGLDGVADDIERVADALGIGAVGERVAADFRESISRTAASVPARMPRPTVYWEWWPKPTITAGRSSWMTALIELAGGTNAFAHLDAESARVSSDEVIRLNPDVIVACWCGARKLANPDLVSKRPGWPAINAVRHDAVHMVLEPCFGRPGPRLADGLRELVTLIHRGPAPTR